ncbi:MAG: protein kinase domain-containing protein, partial [Candidatus Binatia bacterium]
YKVRHVEFGTIHALKVLPRELMQNQEMVERFRLEARRMARLSPSTKPHPHIVQVFDSDRDADLDFYYFVMEYVEGKNLKQIREERGPLSLAEVLTISRQAAQALAHAHNQTPPIIHRDIKPANIMIEKGSNRVVVMDFGIAKELGQNEMTKTGVMVGTLKYSAPEQLRQEPLDGAADIYSLGLVMYEMYTGSQFFHGLDENAILGKVLYDPLEHEPRFNRPTLPDFQALITKAIAKSRERRYKNTEEFLQALEVCQASLALEPTRTIVLPPEGDLTALETEIQKRQQERQQEATLLAQSHVQATQTKATNEEAIEIAKQPEGPRVSAPAPAVSPPPPPPAVPRTTPGASGSPAAVSRFPSLLWPGLGLSVIAAVLLYIFWPAGSPPPPISSPAPASSPTAAPSSPPRLQLAAVTAAIEPFPCSNITAADAGNGTVSLAGSIESAAQRQEVLKTVAGVPGVSQVQDTFAIGPRPFCEVIELLAPFRDHSAEGGIDLQVQTKKGCDAIYYRNEDLVVNVTAQQPLQHVYVDYYVADKEAVAHLLPNPRRRDNLLKGASAVTLGDKTNAAQWQIEPPFGLEMLTVITSPQPLSFAKPRLAPELAAPYITELRQVLPPPAEAANSGIAAAYCFLTSQDR